MGASLAPLDTDERLHALDILRGLALFGMILVHFHQKMRIEVTGVEDLVSWAVWVLVEQKAWGTFAFLFGVGFAVLLRRLEARHAPVTAIYLRRLAALAAFGIAAEVLFGFHILLEYACWGVALLVIRHWSTRALLVTAGVAVLAHPVASALAGSQPPATVPLARSVSLAAAQGSYLALVAARWTLLLGEVPRSWRDLLPDVNLALFCLGLLAVRHRVLDEPRRHVRLIVGVMAAGACGWALWWLGLRNLSFAVPALDQLLCLTYVGGIVLLLAYRPAWTGRLRLVGAAGRMALTNYLLQAAALDWMSSGYGLGLMLRPYLYAAAALVFFSVEAGLSAAWLARFRFGPLEWLWRCVTYARIQPLRRLVAAGLGRVPA